MSKAWVQKEERWAGERKKSRELSTQWGKFISPGILALQGKGCLFHIALRATVFLHTTARTFAFRIFKNWCYIFWYWALQNNNFLLSHLYESQHNLKWLSVNVQISVSKSKYSQPYRDLMVRWWERDPLKVVYLVWTEQQNHHDFAVSALFFWGYWRKVSFAKMKQDTDHFFEPENSPVPKYD